MREKRESNRFARQINGITFIDAVALEESITKDVPVKHRLRQKMINAGVEFWSSSQITVKKPVIGISTIGGFSVCLAGDLPPGMIRLYMGDIPVGPFDIKSIADGLRTTMGIQSSHTYMNPNNKTPNELYKQTIAHGHLSITHSAWIGMTCLGISKKAELEFNCQRDLFHLARVTSARSACQDEPTLFAMTETGAQSGEKIHLKTTEILNEVKQSTNTADWREERNALYPLSASVSLGLNGTLRNHHKLMASINDKGKELEVRNTIALMNDSLAALFPELFKLSSTYGYKYPSSWQQAKNSQSEMGFFAVTQTPPFKEAILLQGAPGVGKSTQTERIVKQLPGVMCISTGNLVRKLLAKKTEGIKPLTFIEQSAAASLDKMARGELMDDKAVYALLMDHLSYGGEGYTEYEKAHTIIFDGVIKAEENIKPFVKALRNFNNNRANTPIKLSKAINISASKEELLERQQTRVAKAVAEKLPQRPDDDVAIYSRRLDKYISTMEKVLDYYRNNYHFIDVNSSHGIERTTQEIIEAIKSNSELIYETQQTVPSC